MNVLGNILWLVFGLAIIWMLYPLFWSKITNWCCRKHLTEIKLLREKKDALSTKCSDLKRQIDAYEDTLTNSGRIIEGNNYNIVCTTSKSTNVIICCDSLAINELCMIKLYNPSASPGVVCHINIRCNSNNICIDDLITQPNHKRAGYARSLLEFVFKLGKLNKCTTITGEISSVDSDEHEWLILFYESLGFKVTMRHSDCGSMIKQL